MEISKFPEILGELSMRKQCVPGSFSSAHAQEPGNEASQLYTFLPFNANKRTTSPSAHNVQPSYLEYFRKIAASLECGSLRFLTNGWVRKYKLMISKGSL